MDPLVSLHRNSDPRDDPPVTPLRLVPLRCRGTSFDVGSYPDCFSLDSSCGLGTRELGDVCFSVVTDVRRKSSIPFLLYELLSTDDFWVPRYLDFFLLPGSPRPLFLWTRVSWEFPSSG